MIPAGALGAGRCSQRHRAARTSAVTNCCQDQQSSIPDIRELSFVTSTLAAGSITRSYNLLCLNTTSRHINDTPSARWRDPEQSCPIRSSTFLYPAMTIGLEDVRLSKRRQRSHQVRPAHPPFRSRSFFGGFSL